MKLLDRYISRKFLFILAFALIAFLSIFIIVDLVERLSDYIDRKVPPVIVASYYFYYVPFAIVLVMPIAMLLASMFSMGQLSKDNELTAMKASGVSLYRILAPVFVIGLVVSIGMMAFAEIVVPVANQRKAEIKNEYIDRLPKTLPTRLSNLYLQEYLGSEGNLVAGRDEHKNGNSRRVFIGFYDSREQQAKKISIQEYDGVFIIHRIDANTMAWDAVDSVWIARDGYEREFRGEQEFATKFDSLALSQLTFTPEALTKVQREPEEMSYLELKRFIAEVSNNGGDPQRWMVDLYLKFSFPFANFIIVLFGAPLASGRVKSGGAVGLALTLVIAFLYFGTVKTGQSLGQNGSIDPMVGAWLGDVIFLVAGVLVLIRARK